MAIYHLSMQIISRSKGQSAVAAASYRSGERLTDERTGEEKYYNRKVQPESMILAPADSPEWVQDRNRLWNEVENAEKRKDSQLARELNVALPRELSKDQQKELLQDYVQNEFVDKGMIADIAIHRDDKENPHAHIMLTMRTVDEKGFGKKNRDWNADFANSKENNRGFVKSGENCLDIRGQWAEYANKALDNAGVQERISHLSNEARGLEQLPTVHLGHVAHAMEKRGVESDRGNINRDRQEYNQLVVDLQQYREEKQALEQEKAQQKEQRQNAEFSTAADRVDLQKASQLLKAEPSLTNIHERNEQLDKWEVRANNGDQYLRWKDEKIREAVDHYRWIKSFENKIQEAQQQIKNIGWNPLKTKVKDRAKEDISKAETEIRFHNEKLSYHREKLGFKTEQELIQVKDLHEKERPGVLGKNKNARLQIRFEREVLQKVETALKNTFVRQVSSMYPNRPEMDYMSFETALNVEEFNKKHEEIVPIETIEKTWNHRKQEIQKLQGDINRVDRNQLRLQRAEGYLNHYEKQNAIVEKYENNPLLKGKLLVSNTAKQEYDRAVSDRNRYRNLMEKESVSGRTDFDRQKGILGKLEVRLPEIKEQVLLQEKRLDIFNAILNGIEKAGKEMEKEKSRQNLKEKRKKGTRRQCQIELDM